MSKPYSSDSGSLADDPRLQGICVTKSAFGPRLSDNRPLPRDNRRTQCILKTTRERTILLPPSIRIATQRQLADVRRRRSQREVVIQMPTKQTWLSLLFWLTLVILRRSRVEQICGVLTGIAVKRSDRLPRRGPSQGRQGPSSIEVGPNSRERDQHRCDRSGETDKRRSPGQEPRFLRCHGCSCRLHVA